jgi:glycosyltransferase involved in cell wall biosynthesis
MVEGRLRVLVIGNLPPFVLGGAENQVARLVEAWARQGVHVEVAGHRLPDGMLPLGRSSIRMHRLRAWGIGGRVGRAVGYALSVTWLALRRGGDFDVVYCRGMGDGLLSLVFLKTMRLCNWPIVACPINARGAGDITFVRSVPGWRYWFRRIDRHVGAINLINTHLVEELRSVGIGRPHMSHIPNGIEVQEPVTRDGVARVRRLVWTGRMGNQKGLDLLLLALKDCLSQGADFRLDLYGDGEQRAALEQQVASSGLAGHVRFHAPIAPSEVRSKLLDADVFVLPSRYEGMSNSALEAMEAGLPVLCTTCGGIDSFIKKGGGWLCEPDSVRSLTAVLLQMFRTSDMELLRHGRIARSLVEEHFALEQVAAANLALLRQIAENA